VKKNDDSCLIANKIAYLCSRLIHAAPHDECGWRAGEMTY